MPGDFELVEAGTALAVFCLLPWAHLRYGHATVDLLWGHYPGWLQRVLATAADALMLLVWCLLVWRMAVVTADYRGNAEVTFILQFRSGGAMRFRWCRPALAASPMPGACWKTWAWRAVEGLDAGGAQH